jgi:8-oxo-dGTP diphosphatase
MDTFPKVADLTADFVLFVIPKSMDDESAKVLLVKRSDDSGAFPGCWAIPGGFLNADERLVECASRELFEETGIELTDENLLYPGAAYIGVFDFVDRDPRKRVISHVYSAIIDKVCDTVGDHPDNDTQDAKWFDLNHLPKLAFDHADIIREAYMKMLVSR